MALSVRENYPLKGHNTFGLDAVADCFIEYGSVAELREALAVVRSRGGDSAGEVDGAGDSVAGGSPSRGGFGQLDFLHIGRGSNLLFSGDCHSPVLHGTISDFEIFRGPAGSDADAGAVSVADFAAGAEADSAGNAVASSEADSCADSGDVSEAGTLAASGVVSVPEWLVRCGVSPDGARQLASDAVYVRAGAGIEWDAFVERTLREGVFGLENLSGIPGEVGAAAVQNIGAYGAEAADYILAVETLDTETLCGRVFLAGECEYSYRHSIFKQAENKRYIITAVIFRLSRVFVPNLRYAALSKKFSPAGSGADGGCSRGAESGGCGSVRDSDSGGWGFSALDLREAVLQMRGEKLPDPSVMGSAGSFYLNPVIPVNLASRLQEQYPEIPVYEVPGDGSRVKLSAAWLIERCGWKGRSVGRAGVYEHQPLVIVNLGGATAGEILSLAEAVVDSVCQKFGVTLRMEVNVVGGKKNLADKK